MTEEHDDISILGDESEIDARNAGFLPGRNVAPEEEPAVVPPPAEEAKPNPVADLAAAQAAIVEGLPDVPDGFIEEPESAEDIAHNAGLLNQALGVGQLSASQRRELVEDAQYRWREEWENPADLANELGRIDAAARDSFVQTWAAEEESEGQASETAAEYLERTSRLSRMLNDAKAYTAQQEEAEEAEERATEAFNDGVAQFRSGLSQADKALEQRALEIFAATVSGEHLAGQTFSSEQVREFLQVSLGVAKQLASADASARISAEFDALDPAPGFMNSPDNRRSVGEHFQAEVKKRMDSGAMAVAPPTHPETIARAQDLSDPRSEKIEAGWRVGGVERSKPAGPPAEIDVGDDGPNSLDSDVERIRRNGWQISKDREPRKRNPWNTNRRKR